MSTREWTLKISCFIKEASHKRLAIVRFLLFEKSRIGKSTETESKLVVAQGCGQVGGGMDKG